MNEIPRRPVYDFSELRDRLKTLLVEDSTPARKILLRYLESYPRSLFDVVEVDSCHAALATLTWQQFDVIVLDLNLPDSEGLHTLRRVNEQAQDAAIVVMTGEDDDDMIVGAPFELGAQDYLVKTDKRSPGAFARSLLCAMQRKQFIDAAKTAAKRYRQAELHLRSMVDSLPVVLYALDNNGMFTLSEGV